MMMFRSRCWPLLFVLILAACSSLPVGFDAVRTPEESPATSAIIPSPVPSITPSQTGTAVVTQVSPASTQAIGTADALYVMATDNPPEPGFFWLGEPTKSPRNTFEVRFHPDGELFVGDLVSLEVIAPDGFEPEGRTVQVELDGRSDHELGSAGFGLYGLGVRTQATLTWVWDTSAARAGEHALTFIVSPDGTAWTESVFLQPRGQLPADEQNARWAHTESECCLVHYITGTAAERDLAELLEMLDLQSEKASLRMESSLPRPLEVTLLPRVIGNGGFADGGISISYLDRNYALGDTAIIFHHELIHILDSQQGGDYRPPFFVEGLAVYLSDGHFKPEPLMPRAAALLPPGEDCILVNIEKVDQQDKGESHGNTLASPEEPCSLGLYIPMLELINDFYTHQHEIGYLEAASLIEYMVDTWGWEAFSDFYRDIHVPSGVIAGGTGSAGLAAIAVDDALQRHFSLDLPALEEQYLQTLERQSLEARWIIDLFETLLIRDRGRAYQKLYDPGSYFLEAWLPDVKLMRERGITADFTRTPRHPENYALETLLQAGGESLLKGDYAQADRLAKAATSVLTSSPERSAKKFQRNPLAADYYALVDLTLSGNWLAIGSITHDAKPISYQTGFQPQQIRVDQNKATVKATSTGRPDLIDLLFIKLGGLWKLLRSG